MTRFLRFTHGPAAGNSSRIGMILLEASFWGGLAIMLWVGYAVLGASRGDGLAVFAEHWQTFALALAASAVALQLKAQGRQPAPEAPAEELLAPPSGLELNGLLRAYGVHQHRALFLYLPMPVRVQDRDAWAWLEVLEARELLGWRSWQIRAEHVSEAIRQSHPELFEGDPTHFEVFRIERRLLGEVLGDAAA